MDDNALLQSFAERGDEIAFAELVRRHAPFVYSVALRRVNGDVPLAQDIAQEVFISMGRKAKFLSRHPALKAWLYTAARYLAAHQVQKEQRRRARENAQSMHEINQPEPQNVEWERLRPWLDTALDQLNERDRTAVILRFFEDRSFGEIGRIQGLSEDGARLRINRAMAKLASAIGRHGITSSTAALALGFGRETMAAVSPIWVEATTRSALRVLHASAPAAGSSVSIIKSITAAKTGAGLAAAVVLVVAAAGWWEWKLAYDRGRELAALHRQVEMDRQEAKGLLHQQAELHSALRRTGEFTAATDTLTRRVGLLRAWFARNSAFALPEFHALGSRDWITIAYEHPEIDAGGDLWPVARFLRDLAIQKAEKSIQEALKLYNASPANPPLRDPTQLLQYAPDLDPACLVRYSAFPDIRAIKRFATSPPGPALVSHPEVDSMPGDSGGTNGHESWRIITDHSLSGSNRIIGDNSSVAAWP